MLDFALLSPDATHFADFAFTSEGAGTTAIFNLDGSGYRPLPTSYPAIPPNGLPGGTWSAGETRIAAAAGDPGNIPPSGIFSRRSSDGRGVIRLTDAGTRFDYPVASSPDGSKLLFFRPDAKNETSDSAPQDLFVVGANGKGLTRVTPRGTTTAIVFSYDSVSWSPDGTKVAVAAAKEPFWNTSIIPCTLRARMARASSASDRGATSGMRSGRRTGGGSRSRWPRRQRVACSSST